MQAVEIMWDRRLNSAAIGIDTLERYRQARELLDRHIRAQASLAEPNLYALGISSQMRDDLNKVVYARAPKFQAADDRYALDLAYEEAMRLGRALPLRSGPRLTKILDAVRELERRFGQPAAEDLRKGFTHGVLRKLTDDVLNAGGLPIEYMQGRVGGIGPAPRLALQIALGAPLPGARLAKPDDAAIGAIKGEPIPYAAGLEIARAAIAVLEDEAP